MAQIICADCLKKNLPYSYLVALLRVLMYGYTDWWEFEDERVIEKQFRKHLRDPTVRSWLINKTRTYSDDDSFAEDFKFYYQYLENTRRKNISATFLCFDCEKYYCTNCVSKHSGHFTFSKDDKYDISKWGIISVEILKRLSAEGDQKRENMKREHIFPWDVVDVRCKHDKLYLYCVLHKLRQELEKYDDRFRYEKLDPLIYPRVEGLHILNNRKWLVTDHYNNRIKLFNINDNKMTRCIRLSSSPCGITEIPSIDPSYILIAVSFPRIEQIRIMNVRSVPPHVISSISVHGRCYDLAYCNNKLITRCREYLNGEYRHSIHVMDISGKKINIIRLHNLPGITLGKPDIMCTMSVHSESETIYACHGREPSCVISLSLDGQVLHSVTFTDLKPLCICVDKDQDVYVIGYGSPIYKLSADLIHREKIMDTGTAKSSWIRAIRFHNDKFYLASNEGHVYIIHHDSSRRHDKHEHHDENRPVVY